MATPDAAGQPDGVTRRTVIITVGGRDVSEPETEADEEDGIKPLPERLVTELTAHRTLALRDALANDPDTAFVAVLHALCLGASIGTPSATCLEIRPRAPASAHRRRGWPTAPRPRRSRPGTSNGRSGCPETRTISGTRWWPSTATARRRCSRIAPRSASTPCTSPGTAARAASPMPTPLARAVGLDMAAAGWTPTVDNYLGRVTKARILEAVREAKGDASAQLIDHLKKPDMAKEAERLLAGTGWLPEPLRTPTLRRSWSKAKPVRKLCRHFSPMTGTAR